MKKRHNPEKIFRKLREADTMLAAGKTIGQAVQALEVSEQTYHRWRNKYGGMKAEEAGRLKELEMLYVEPGSPWENGFAESFFSRMRDELLNVEEFMNLAEARWSAKRRLHEHNEERPHSSLGYRTPAEFATQCAASIRATPSLQQPTAKNRLLPVTQPVLS